MDQLLSVAKGVIVGADEGYVTVRFPAYDSTVDFLDNLFDKELLRYGQPVTYEIWRTPGGWRYEVFTAREDDQENPYLKEVEELLSKIKLKEKL